MQPAKISIIVPVYNRADEINDFLDSFNQQTQQDGWEIIIVDDGSSDNLKEVIDTFKDKMVIKYFHQQNQGPGKARNRGMKEASGNVMIFIDSDCTVPENYISTLFKYLDDYDFDAFGGPDSQKDDFPPFLKAVNYSMTSFLGTGGTRGSSGKSVAKYYPRSFNMGIKRKVYDKIGGMNDLRHGQDMEFSNRIYRSGFKVKYLPELVVFHKRRTNLRRFYKQIFNWGVTRINLGTIDSQMLKPVHALPAFLVVIFIITVILSCFVPIMRYLLFLEGLMAVLAAFTAFFQSSTRNKSVKIGLLSIVTLYTQIIAYGLGFLTGCIKKIFTPRGEWVTGFTKKYYK